MIYDSDECAVIESIRNRKSSERVIYNSMEFLPPSFISAMDCQMQLDLSRCDAMLRIAKNDFSNLDEDLIALAPHPI
ncbi:hypothetical protein PED39_06895 [Methanomassiliicoccales archaeon LGM-RCC1]|nr:hypothetical protein PED39_06895 [Methanomassiliicoccales archaeon LGM-RCC1]